MSCSNRVFRLVVLLVSGGAIGAFIACSSDNSPMFSSGVAASGGSGAAAGSGGTQGGNGGSAAGGGSGGIIVPIEASTDVTEEACATATASASLLPTYLQFLVDISGSMNCNPSDPPTVGCDTPGPDSKWVLTRKALESAIAMLPASTGAGVISYPNVVGGSNLCFSGQAAVPLALLDDAQRQLINSTLDATTPSGATPTEDAYLYTTQSFGTVPAAANKFIVLITDGMPTVGLGCIGNGEDPVDTSALPDEAHTAAAAGVKTFVIGSPGSQDFRSSLSQMALQGSTGPAGCSNNGPNYCHLDMTTQPDFGQAISDALAAIASKAISCTFDVPDPSPGVKLDLNYVNVIYVSGGGPPQYMVYSGSDAGTCSGNGWTYTLDKKQIILCDQTCQQVQADSQASISIQFGCATHTS